MQKKNIRIWAMLDPENYTRLLITLASTVETDGKKMKIGDFVAEAVIEKMNKEELNGIRRSLS
jgi:hypothetical protein